MSTFLFDEIIFGPVTSRRLGNSLGINLLPSNRKVCNFNCLYCECGLTENISHSNNSKLPDREEVLNALKHALTHFQPGDRFIDTITFAGNGEPTMHPDFCGIVEDTILLRDQHSPRSKIAVLSNATLIDKESIRKALMKVDYNILKLDSAIEETIRLLNCPMGSFSLKNLKQSLLAFRQNLTIQTLFIRGEYKGKRIDNTSEEEISKWLELLKELSPQLVMIYTIARDTPVKSLEKVDAKTLNEIASKVISLGIPVSIST
jgi:wyosine [tRNA(Phe)-imidazoG37] synthetase (radical SAM superfamily)